MKEFAALVKPAHKRYVAGECITFTSRSGRLAQDTREELGDRDLKWALLRQYQRGDHHCEKLLIFGMVQFDGA